MTTRSHTRLFASAGLTTVAVALFAILPAASRAAAADSVTPSSAPVAVEATATATSNLMPATLSASACRKMAEQRLKAGDADAAISLFQQGIAQDAHDPDLYAGLADAEAAKGRTDAAIHDWRLACGEDDNQAWSSSRMLEGDLCLRFAQYLVDNGKADEAARMYAEGCEPLAKQDRALLPEKWSGRDLKRSADARRRFTASVQTALGMRYMDMGHTEEATVAFHAALAAVPGDSVAQFRYGRALFALGRKQEAVAAWRQVAQSNERLDLRASAEEALASAR